MNTFTTDLQKYIHVSKYARWMDKENRRETWEESVKRFISFWENQTIGGSGINDALIEPDILKDIEKSILRCDIMPSMRGIMTAGKALERDNIAQYNCTASAVIHPAIFSEAFYILMNGCGFGFSVERQYINELPEIAEEFYETETALIIRDSKIGWATGLKELISMLYNGQIPKWDLSKIRPAGARLKTFGGRACLTGDTILYKDRKKNRGYNEITIKELYEMERSKGFWKNKPNHFNKVKIRSLDEKSGQFYRNNVITVIDNGFAPVYEIITENGYRIKATGNHRFMNSAGEYQYLDNFDVGMDIAVNGSKEKKTGICVDCGISISRRAKRCVDCNNIHQTSLLANDTTARQRKACVSYKKDICEMCDIIDDGSVRFERHHIDHNPHNNDESNLMYLCVNCHQKEEAKYRTFGDPYSHRYISYDNIISIRYMGEEQVYDLQMEAPNHNFVANGFISHNSGPEPLNKLFKHVVSLFKNASGRKLTSIECHDLMCFIADTVIVGSVRRAALISLSNLTDDRMRRAKDGQWWQISPHRALANNSVAYTEKPDLDSFSKEWRTLYKSKSGERGIWNKEGAKLIAEERGREFDGDYIPNPCFTGDMKLLTEHGYQRFDKLCGTKPKIINKDHHFVSSDIWCSGIKPIILLNFGNRDPIKCTYDHIFMDVDGNEIIAEKLLNKRLMPDYFIKNEWDIEDFKAGFIQGDGNTTRLKSDNHKGLEINIGKKDKDIAKLFDIKEEYDRIIYSREYYCIAENYKLISETLPNRPLSDFIMNMEDCTSFLAGLFSANGCVIKHQRISLKSSCYELIHQVKNMLEDLDINSYITTNKSKMIKWDNGDYTSKESYDLNISKLSDIIKFSEYISFGHEYKRNALNDLILKKAPLVSSIIPCGNEKVYDFSEPKTHWGIVEGVIVHNCGEVSIRDSGGVCNLTEVMIRPNDSFNMIKKKIRLATIMGTIQATLTNFRFLRKVWKTNAEEERLLGVSLTGIMDHKIFSNQATKKEISEWFGMESDLETILDYLREYSHNVNKRWAKKFGINSTGHVCVVKPSGTVSILTGTSSGIHPRYGKYYIRRVRNDKKDPLSLLMIEEGVPYVDEGDKYVFSFFVKSPDHSIVQKDIGAMKQLSIWKIYKENWCDGNPSQTIYYTDDDYFAIADWLWQNWDVVGGLSFFPYTNASDGVYINAPLEEISKEEYTKSIDNFPKNINWSRLVEFEKIDSTESAMTLACSGGKCELT